MQLLGGRVFDMANEKSQTIRKEIIGYLENDRLTARDISKLVGIMEKDVYHHLAFIDKTVRQQKKRVCFDPYYCMSCGFRFKKRESFKKPGKCPGCKDGRISSAVFWIDGTENFKKDRETELN